MREKKGISRTLCLAVQNRRRTAWWSHTGFMLLAACLLQVLSASVNHSREMNEYDCKVFSKHRYTATDITAVSRKLWRFPFLLFLQRNCGHHFKFIQHLLRKIPIHFNSKRTAKYMQSESGNKWGSSNTEIWKRCQKGQAHVNTY